MSTNEPNMAKPATRAVKLVNRISRRASIRMSTIDSATRSSAQPQATSKTAAAAKSPRIRPEVQPQLSPSVNASSKAIKPPEVSDDHAGQHEPEAAADPEHGRYEPDRNADLLARELVANDPEAEREDGSAGTLNRACADESPDVPCERRHDRS